MSYPIKYLDIEFKMCVSGNNRFYEVTIINYYIIVLK